MPVWKLTLKSRFNELHHIWLEAPSHKMTERAWPLLQRQFQMKATGFIEIECKFATLTRISRIKHPENYNHAIYFYDGKECPKLKPS